MADYRVPILDTFDWQESILSRATTPPGGPVKGNRYIIKATAQGGWAGHEDDLTYYDGSNWQFYTPTAGWIGFVVDEGLYYYWTGSVWKVLVNSNQADLDEFFVEVMG